MKSKSVFGLSILGLATAMSMTAAVHADPICGTLEQCRAMQAQVEARIQELLKDVTPKLTGILKSGVTQYEAESICRDKGMRLPTARELALVAQSLGAQGISETEKDGYYLVKGSDSAGNPDHFYFSYKGYSRPAGDLGRHVFWSSSVHPVYSIYAYDLDGVFGGIEGVRRSHVSDDGAVRCMR